MAAPEKILASLIGGDKELLGVLLEIGPVIVGFPELTDCDGWLVDLASTEPHVHWDDARLSPVERTVRALLVACDYAVRRGAADDRVAREIIRRESPIAIANPRELDVHIRALLESLDLVGPDTPSRRRRALGHALTAPTRTDPVLSFHERHEDVIWGDDALSSFVLTNEGKRDGVTITGQVSERWGVEIGLREDVPMSGLPAIESTVGEIPSFLGGNSSSFDGTSIIVAWARPITVSAEDVGRAIHGWTRALFDLDLVDVRIVFAPSRSRSARLTDMRSRAREYRLYRDAVIAGNPNPAAVVRTYQDRLRESE